MSATDIHQTTIPELPKPLEMGLPDMDLLSAPKKPKTAQRMNVTSIPIQLEQRETVGDLFEDTLVEPANEWKDPDEMLETIFFNKHNNLLYKLFIDGTWESLRLLPNRQ